MDRPSLTPVHVSPRARPLSPLPLPRILATRASHPHSLSSFLKFTLFRPTFSGLKCPWPRDSVASLSEFEPQSAEQQSAALGVRRLASFSPRASRVSKRKSSPGKSAFLPLNSRGNPEGCMRGGSRCGSPCREGSRAGMAGPLRRVGLAPGTTQEEPTFRYQPPARLFLSLP